MAFQIPYMSRSTAVFANHCTPSKISVSIGGYFTVTCHGRMYRVDRHITLRQRDGTWQVDQITPWSVPFVNRTRATQTLREAGYKEFRLWLGVYLQMASPSQEFGGWASDDKIIDMVRNRQWRELVTLHFPNHPANHILYKVRQAFYRKYGCIERKSVPFLGRKDAGGDK